MCRAGEVSELTTGIKAKWEGEQTANHLRTRAPAGSGRSPWSNKIFDMTSQRSLTLGHDVGGPVVLLRRKEAD